MSYKIVAVEGICCSGKSTLVGQLQKNDGFETIKEYWDYTESFPKLAKSAKDLYENTEFFIELERRRYQDSLSRRSYQALVLDRSFVTYCAFDYAAFSEADLASHLPAIETLWQKEERKLVPDTVFVLEVNEENFKNRLRQSGKTLTPLLRNPKFNHLFYQYLGTMTSRWGVRLIKINTNNLVPDQVTAKVLELL